MEIVVVEKLEKQWILLKNNIMEIIGNVIVKVHHFGQQVIKDKRLHFSMISEKEMYHTINY